MTATADSPAWVENRPTDGRFTLPVLSEMLRYRELALALALRDLQVRYKQTFFGVAWAVVQPLAATGALTFVFHGLAELSTGDIPYGVFVLAGMVGWTFFSSGLSRCATALVNNEEMITKIYFPRLLLCVAAILPGVADLMVSLLLLAVAMALTGVGTSATLLALPLLLVLLSVFTFGVGCLAAAVNVRYRDVGNAVPLLLQIWLFLSPVAYESDLADHWAYYLNPMAGMVDALRWSIFGGPAPPAEAGLSAAVGLVLTFVGLWVFGRTERRLRGRDLMNAIEIRGLGKRYRIGQTASTTLREAIPALLRPGKREVPAEVWALREVDLDVQEGEVLGLVGSNGAGKSTLLKVLARITEPTVGVSRTRGRVGALLDVGTGFHGELTGRENVYVNGALLGLSGREIRARLDDIVAFAEVERFIDTPLKRYSSGMQLRLAFAIAAEIRPEIVVVDEVLAVGDAEFQRRCIGRMSDMQSAGRTVLFVSHDAGTMAQLCSRVVWLKQGRIVDDGPTREVLARYLSSGQGVQGAVTLEPRAGIDLSPIEVSVRGDAGEPRRGESLTVRTKLHVATTGRAYDIAVILTTQDGTRVLDEAWSDRHDQPLDVAAGGVATVALTLPPVLAAGRYGLTLWLGTPFGTIYEERVLTFDVAPEIDDTAEAINRHRLIQPSVDWSLEPEPGRVG